MIACLRFPFDCAKIDPFMAIRRLNWRIDYRLCSIRQINVAAVFMDMFVRDPEKPRGENSSTR